MEKSFLERVLAVQSKLRAPKDKVNQFGGYRYRSAESILEAVKPLLAEAGLLMTITDSVECINGRFYVRATVTITDGNDIITGSAYAREEDAKKGACEPMLTGASSSYARKYALSALLLVDDGQDPDADGHHNEVLARQRAADEEEWRERQQARQKVPADLAALTAEMERRGVSERAILKQAKRFGCEARALAELPADLVAQMIESLRAMPARDGEEDAE